MHSRHWPPVLRSYGAVGGGSRSPEAHLIFRYPNSVQGGSSPALLRVEVVGDEQAVTVDVRGELDIATADSLLAAVRHGLGKQPGLVSIELSRVSFFSAAGLHALLAVRRLVHEHAASLVLTAPSTQVRTVLELAQVEELFKVAG